MRSAPRLRTACLAALMASTGFASGSGLYSDYHPEGPRWRVEVDGGWAGTGLGAITAMYRKAGREAADDFVTGFGGAASSSARGGTGGILVSGDLGYAVSPGQGAGIRVSWLKPAEIVATFSGDHPLLHETESEHLALSLVSIMAGGWGERVSSAGLTARLSVYAGIGLATLDERYESSVTGPFFAGPQNDSASSRWEGTATVAGEAGVDLGYRLPGGWAVFLGGGYTLARVRSMTASRDATDSSGQPYVRKGDVFPDDRGAPLLFDFSGLHATAGIRIAL